MKKSLRWLVLAGLLLWVTGAQAQDKNFFIFLCLGQSNMEGYPGIPEEDKAWSDPRFQVLAAVDFPKLDRKKGNWYAAVPPLCRPYSGLSPADYFGRTLAAKLPPSIRVGVVNVSVAGCKIELFDETTREAYAATVPSWMKGIIAAYDGSPYRHLVAMAKQAQQAGVIKGILLHQGEGNTNDREWPAKVKVVYENLLKDLDLKAADVPLLAGELVGVDQQGQCASMNEIIAGLPKVIPTAHVVSSQGCPALPDHLHFTPEGYRELGRRYAAVMLPLLGFPPAAASAGSPPAKRHTTLSIAADSFLINGEPTFKGRVWRGHRIEGLLPNARVVQGVFDDLNPATSGQWAYPDTGKWDAGRNTREFVAAMSAWRQHGLLGITLNLQGGSPLGYGNKGWINPAFTEDGSLRPDYFQRLELILDRADELGMAVILGLFYFGQDQNLRDEAAVLRAADLTLAWLHDRDYRHVIIEACNETSERGYHHAALRLPAMPALLQHLRETGRSGWRFPVGVSLSGGEVPTAEIVAASDVILIHGNNRRGVETTPARIREMIAQTRALPGFRPMPVVINEDDHYAFDQPDSNFLAATGQHVSWGFFDFRRPGEPMTDGFQSVPVDWTISSPRKRGFFELLDAITQR